MPLDLTLAILAASLIGAVLANYMNRRPTKPGKVRLIPYMGIQFVCIVIVFLMLAHLVTLFTGEPFKGRYLS